MKDRNGQILQDGVAVRRRLAAEYFKQVLNMEYAREVGDNRIPVLEELNERCNINSGSKGGSECNETE